MLGSIMQARRSSVSLGLPLRHLRTRSKFSFTSANNFSTSGDKTVDHLGSYDNNYTKYQIPQGEPARREFIYLTLGGARFIYASMIRLGIMRFIGAMSASADVLALADLEVNIGEIPPGEVLTVKWRGKPVFIKHRTSEEIEDAQGVDISTLRDPQTDGERIKEDKWLIALGICTHLGCVPMSNAGDYKGGWFCPCHGSHYDVSGRIRKGPAPLNLEIPPYKFMEGDMLVIGGGK